MDVAPAPDIVQDVLDFLRHPIKESDVYIQNASVFNNYSEENLVPFDNILNILKENIFTKNPEIFEWAIQETYWHGYWLTLTGIKPRKRKIYAIPNI